MTEEQDQKVHEELIDALAMRIEPWLDEVLGPSGWDHQPIDAATARAMATAAIEVIM